ncbi:MAG: anti-sigma factor [Opitutaceae bacterium]
MIDERQEELAALYALDLLEGAERSQFETTLARDPALQSLVRELRDSSASLVHLAPNVAPPTALKARILSSIGGHKTAAPSAAAPASPDNIIRPNPAAFRVSSILPWAVAACFAIAAGWLGQLYLSSRSEAELLRSQQTLADLALKQAQNQLEGERLLNTRQIGSLNEQLADSTRRLGDLQRNLSDTEQRRLAVQTQEAEARRELQAAQTRLAAAEKLATDTRTQAAQTERDLRAQADLANFKIATLASMLDNSPQALAVAIWNPARQEGVFAFEKMPVPETNQDLQLWVIEGAKAPVSAGLLAIGSDGRGRVTFKPETPIADVATVQFAVSRERRGGAPARSGPQGQVIMIVK